MCLARANPVVPQAKSCRVQGIGSSRFMVLSVRVRWQHSTGQLVLHIPLFLAPLFPLLLAPGPFFAFPWSLALAVSCQVWTGWHGRFLVV